MGYIMGRGVRNFGWIRKRIRNRGDIMGKGVGDI